MWGLREARSQTRGSAAQRLGSRDPGRSSEYHPSSGVEIPRWAVEKVLGQLERRACNYWLDCHATRMTGTTSLADTAARRGPERTPPDRTRRAVRAAPDVHWEKLAVHAAHTATRGARALQGAARAHFWVPPRPSPEWAPPPNTARERAGGRGMGVADSAFTSLLPRYGTGSGPASTAARRGLDGTPPDRTRGAAGAASGAHWEIRSDESV